MDRFIVIDWIKREILTNDVVYNETNAKAIAYERVLDYASLQSNDIEIIKLNV